MPDLNQIKQGEQGPRDRRGRYEKGRFPPGARPTCVSRRCLPPRHSGEGGHLGAAGGVITVGEARHNSGGGRHLCPGRSRGATSNGA
jgi:hypothetical protein